MDSSCLSLEESAEPSVEFALVGCREVVAVAADKAVVQVLGKRPGELGAEVVGLVEPEFLDL